MLTENLTESGTNERDMMLRIAVAYMRRLNERRDTYERECAEYARQGYRPHYCIHGTNQWTDYDNICGSCEQGYTDRELALMWATADARQWIERFHDTLNFEAAARKHSNVSQALINEMWAWVSEPLAILDYRNPANAARPRRNLP